jgi:hypothetical protein
MIDKGRTGEMAMAQRKQGCNRAIPLSAYLGKALRRGREVRGLRQDDIATTARTWGLSWTRSDVAAIESGRRSLSANELLLLPWIVANEGSAVMKQGNGHPVELTDLFPSRGDWIALTPRFLFSDVAIQAILRGEADSRDLASWIQDAPASGLHGGSVQRIALATIAENETIIRHFRLTDKDRPILEAAHADKLADAEQKAARRMRTFPLAVAVAARKQWGRSFTGERDHRVVMQASPGASSRTLQALRGHVTRELLDELREDGIEGLSVRRAERTKRRSQDGQAQRPR